MSNKIRYGLSKCYYAVCTEGASDSWSTPVALPGAVSLSMDAEGDTNTFYADNTSYWTQFSNNGYSGELEVAAIDDDFRKNVLGEVLSREGNLVEYKTATTNKVALLFQFEGDEKASRHVLYKCSISRPSDEANTSEDSITPDTTKLSYIAIPASNGQIKASAGTAEYDSWLTTAPALQSEAE